jgi:hypothetical protein
MIVLDMTLLVFPEILKRRMIDKTGQHPDLAHAFGESSGPSEPIAIPRGAVAGGMHQFEQAQIHVRDIGKIHPHHSAGGKGGQKPCATPPHSGRSSPPPGATRPRIIANQSSVPMIVSAGSDTVRTALPSRSSSFLFQVRGNGKPEKASDLRAASFQGFGSIY